MLLMGIYTISIRSELSLDQFTEKQLSYSNYGKYDNSARKTNRDVTRGQTAEAINSELCKSVQTIGIPKWMSRCFVLSLA